MHEVELRDTGPSVAWISLPPAAIVRITAGSALASLPDLPASPPNSDDYNSLNCDSFLPSGTTVAPGTNPTLFQFRLDPDGTVHDASLVRSSGNGDLDQTALTCANHAHREEAILGHTRAHVTWTGGVLWSGRWHGFFEPDPDGTLAAKCETHYPPDALRLRQQGDTIVGFRIGTDGKPKDETVVLSSGSAPLDEAARRCVHSFKYFPAGSYGDVIELSSSARIEWRILGS